MARPDPTRAFTKTAASDDFEILKNPDEAPAWAVKYGKEFWRRARADGTRRKPGPKASELSLKLPPCINIGDVIDRVSHAWVRDLAEPVPRVLDNAYTATLDEGGLRFRSRQPERASDLPGGNAVQNRANAGLEQLPAQSSNGTPDEHPRLGQEAEAVFRTVSIRLENRSVYESDKSKPVWSILGNTAQALLNADADVVEHFEAKAEGVAVSWILSKPLRSGTPEGANLVVEAELAGLDYAGQTESGYHFADTNGTARLIVGNAKVVDAGGQSWDVETQERANHLTVTVPAAVLAHANYPLAIDPVIGPEFGIDNPVLIPSGPGRFEVSPAIASNGRDYLAVWRQSSQYPAGSGTAIYGARVSSAGFVLDPQGLSINPPALNNYQKPSVRVASSGADYLVVWQAAQFEQVSNHIYGARVSSAGTVLDTNAMVISRATGTQTAPAVAGNAAGYLVVWQDSRSGVSNIYGAQITTAGSVLQTNGIPISLGQNTKIAPAIAATAGGYLLVWQDSRNFPTNASHDIYGARVSNSGVVPDTNGFPIRLGKGSFSPAVVANANDYFAVWDESGPPTTIHGARITSAGVVLDTNSIPLNTTVTCALAPAVAANGSDYLVVWQDSSRPGFTGPTNIYATRVTGAGVVLDTNSIAIGHSPTNAVSPAVAANGTNYLVLWQDARSFSGDIYGARVTSAGAVEKTNGFLISAMVNAESTPAVAFDGTNYLVVWTDSRDYITNGSDIFGARINDSGAVADPNGVAISRGPGSRFDPAVAANSTGFLVIWKDYRYGSSDTRGDIFGARVTRAGVVLDTNGIAISTDPMIQDAPAVAAGQSDFLVVWMNESPSYQYEVYGTLISSAGIVANSNGVPLTFNSDIGQGYPAVAFNGNIFLMVWADARNIASTGYDIYGARVSSSGVLLDTNPIPICTFPYLQTYPALASNGRDFLAVWADYRNYSAINLVSIFGARISPSGSVLDQNGFPIVVSTRDAEYPAVASYGTNYFVVWEDARISSGLEIFGARVADNSVVLDTSGLLIDTSPSRQPAIASDDSGQLLVVDEGALFGATRTVANFVSLAAPPVAQSQSLVVYEDTPLAISLTSSNSGGPPLTYSIVTQPANGTLSGTPPNLIYLAFTNYIGTDSFSFEVAAGVLTSAVATVSLTVIPANGRPTPVVRISPTFLVSTNQTNLVVIAADRLTATVIFDASGSTDPENDPISFTWFDDGSTNAYASGPITTNTLAIGNHTIQVTLSAGDDVVSTNITVQVITPAEAVGQILILVDDVNLGSKNKQPLIASLSAAIGSFDRGELISAANQLAAFQHKVQVQISPFDSVTGQQFTNAAAQILFVLSGR